MLLPLHRERQQLYLQGGTHTGADPRTNMRLRRAKPSCKSSWSFGAHAASRERFCQRATSRSTIISSM